MHFRPKTVQVKTPREIEIMREAGHLTAETLSRVADIIRPGITTDEINQFVHEDTLRLGCKPAPLNYLGFPKSVCTSVNEVICHGIPGAQRIKDGDIINVDVTHIYKGYHGDTSATFYVGTPSEDAKKVTEIARRSLDLAIAEVKPGARLGDIGAAIQEFAEPFGVSVVTDFVGHGIGRKFHEEPKVLHVGTRGRGIRLKAGMTFTIEPMINLGVPDVEILEDEWTAITADGKLSAQFEHTLVVTDTGCEILTARTGVLKNSEIFPNYWTERGVG
ncbi:MAG TPA: type I methionyl aminopeptidase [Polyangiaceae bacterium]|jgi:methionyl aminopeptidase|nr:type I methionyl aminopeptidase [Polyangiaceae bacterium]